MDTHTSYQVWIQCPKTETQALKGFLGKNLSRLHKVRKAGEEGFVLVPTDKSRSGTFSAKSAEGNTDLCRAILHELSLKWISSTLRLKVRLIEATSFKNTISQLPIEAAVAAWLLSIPKASVPMDKCPSFEELLKDVPKRWSVYHPMVLLPSGSFQSVRWKPFLDHIKGSDRAKWLKLWEAVLEAVGKLEGKLEGKNKLTHLAVNSGIPLESKSPKQRKLLRPKPSSSNNSDSEVEDERGNQDLEDCDDREQIEKALIARQNILRSPSGLVMLYGDFGPCLTDPEDDIEPKPTEQDLTRAFWVNTNQNGIHQCWAPRYTMFSRGNVKEKARLLNFHNFDDNQILGSEVDSRRTAITYSQLQESAAVDLYAGIGYFVFSYLKMGIGRVFCWEINPWSIEGLRRGAKKNGWSIKILSKVEMDQIEAGQLNKDLLSDVRIVVFPEDNIQARWSLTGLMNNKVLREPIIHVNCGLLPTSEPSWHIAIKTVSLGKSEAWLHLHENLSLAEIEKRREQILQLVQQSVGGKFSLKPFRGTEVEHVELVKTFAPGIWHCVFDVYVGPGGNSNNAISLED